MPRRVIITITAGISTIIATIALIIMVGIAMKAGGMVMAIIAGTASRISRMPDGCGQASKRRLRAPFFFGHWPIASFFFRPANIG